ncbi:MAG: DUF177 domain-containing protein [Clostridia bacterium]|nr:DUF177 domain-containing protein [Clostridia bacterium]
MITIDVRKLNAQKKYVGRMEFEYSAPDDLIEIPFVKFASPVKVCFDYELFEDDSLEARGTVQYRLQGQCSRCLKDATMEIVGELDAYFQPFKNGEDYSYSGGVIDLTKAIDEAVMASLPFSLSCGDDCQSIPFSSEPN